MPTSEHSQNDLLSVSQAAALVGVSLDTIRRWDNDGRIQSVRTPTGHRRFRRGDVEALLQPSPAAPADTTAVSA
ncbi:helix-turn-helix domain-containing protein [Pseudokineococcus marinus]|uniref:Excisionase family DNA-binding protein n=1 Tax=Pseudokineococcus marinus TaxID=351215 RepID=A0A849C142_9ACTN|nr:helix-turn-helix domain-containing protein [Pseudokineococcus marinus]NNH23408.1 excisionase family DNA-binding protein [Pseudokineococcus marinus]